jgi:hypothetical protein
MCKAVAESARVRLAKAGLWASGGPAPAGEVPRLPPSRGACGKKDGAPVPGTTQDLNNQGKCEK